MSDTPRADCVSREIVATVHEKRVAACHDGRSLWVEIAGPKGGNAWEMTPELARGLALGLMTAAAKAESHR